MDATDTVAAKTVASRNRSENAPFGAHCASKEPSIGFRPAESLESRVFAGLAMDATDTVAAKTVAGSPYYMAPEVLLMTGHGAQVPYRESSFSTTYWSRSTYSSR